MQFYADAINKAKADLHPIFDGSWDLENMRVASLQIQTMMAQAIAMKEKVQSLMAEAKEKKGPTAEETAIAEAVDEKLGELTPERTYDALEASGAPLTVADVKRVLKGAVLFVIEAQTYDAVTSLDNSSHMFAECSPAQPLGYFQGSEDTDIATVGSGSDVWYLANATTLDALKKIV
jgi:hypothetical protein